MSQPVEGRTASRWASYPGDKRPMLGQVRGDFLVVEAAYNPVTDRTRVGFDALTLDDYEALLDRAQTALGVSRPKKKEARRGH